MAAARAAFALRMEDILDPGRATSDPNCKRYIVSGVAGSGEKKRGSGCMKASGMAVERGSARQ